MATYLTEIVKADGLTLPRIVWSLFKRQPIGFVEKVYTANRGLADLGPLIPAGTEIRFPLDDVEAEQKSQVVKLWD